MPDWKPEILRRLASLKLAPAREAEIAEEIAQHLEDRYEELLASGQSEDAAFCIALDELKGEDLLARSLRPVEGTRYREPIAPGKDAGNFLSGILQDLRYALRMLRKSPGFTTVAILTLALGIGATTAIFTIVNQVILKPLPYPHPNRIVGLVGREGANSYQLVSIPMYVMWRSETRLLEDIIAQQFVVPVNLLGGEHPEQLQMQRVTSNFFALSGFPMAMGRAFTAKEDTPGGLPVAVITYELWQRRFGANPRIIGKAIDLDNTTYTVIGVLSPLPPTNAGGVDVYLPLQLNLNSLDQGALYSAFGRLKRGVTVAQADAALKLATEQFGRRYPHVLDKGEVFAAVPVQQMVSAGLREALLLFLGAVGFVLLIACANVANLLLGRETGRQREIAVRVALGAGRSRIIQQILTESVLLSLVGGVLGVAVGYAGVRALLNTNLGQLPWVGLHGQAVALDWRVLLFALGISALTGGLAGLIPAIRASHTNLAEAMKESGSRAGAGVRQNKTRSLLVVVEMALAVVLLAGAGLLIRTFHDLRSVKPGFDAHNILTMDMSLTGTRFAKTAAVAELVRDGEQRLDSLPGVEVAAASCCLPPAWAYASFPYNIEGRAPTVGEWSGNAEWRSVSLGFFQAFRIPLRRGRAFTINDSGSSPPVIIINEAMVKQYWPKGGELGARITIGKGAWVRNGPTVRGRSWAWLATYATTEWPPNPYPPCTCPWRRVSDALNETANAIQPLAWVIHTRVAPLTLEGEIQKQLRIASGGLPVGRVQTMEEVMAQSTVQTSFDMTLLVIFAWLALVLAAIGIYGVISYSVTQRTHEIGIRMALGASPERVRRTIVGQGVVLAVVGMVIGVGAGLGVTRLLQGLLFGVKPWDPLAFADGPSR
ncbi:MAG: ADOP family duplicated permease [Candidatus Acidiferrales bacterium]